MKEERERCGITEFERGW